MTAEATGDRGRACAKCVLPGHYPQISFDDKGVCNYCRGFRPWTLKGEAALRELLDAARAKAGKYDCVIGVSGGIDSTYALYYLVRQCNLRVLAFTADHGFIPEPVKANIRRMTEKLGVDLVMREHDLLRRIAKDNIAAWLRHPSPAMVPMICCGCRLGILRGLHDCAREHAVPLIVSGSGVQMETCYFKRAYFAVNPLGRLFPHHRQLYLALGLLYEFLRNPRYLRPANLATYLREYREAFRGGLPTVQLFEYVPWDEETVLSTITRELGWTRPVDGAGAWRSDCKIALLKQYLLKQTAGFTEKDDYLGNMIRSGRITREEALARLAAEAVVSDDVLAGFFNELGLDFDKVRAALREAAPRIRGTA